MSKATDSYPIVGWGKNMSATCAECGRLVRAYHNNYQTKDGSLVWHPECIEIEPYHAKRPNLLYYTDG